MTPFTANLTYSVLLDVVLFSVAATCLISASD